MKAAGRRAAAAGFAASGAGLLLAGALLAGAPAAEVFVGPGAASGSTSGSAAPSPAGATRGAEENPVGSPVRPPAGDTVVDDTVDAAAWRMPPMNTAMPMLPSLRRLRPGVDPFLPLAGVPVDSLPPARARRTRELADGDTLVLRAGPVRKELRGRTFRMWGYNGQIPGPLLEVPEGAEVVVRFRNDLTMPSTVHWHGVRLDNRFDGVPGVTQEPVAPGASFVYRVRFRDAGVYWYHPHLREDVQQDMGLSGNMMVRPATDGWLPPVNREEVLILDDLLVDEEGLYPWGREAASMTLMGRFGNVMLVNGRPDWETEVPRGSVVRFWLTNVSNTRTWNLDFGDAPMKVVAADVGRFEREETVESVVLAPAQRYAVDVRFPEAGTYPLVNRVQAIDHYRGEFRARVDTLGRVEVTGEPPGEDLAASFRTRHRHPGVRDELGDLERHRRRAPDRVLEMTMRDRGLPAVLRRMMELDSLYTPPVEWNDAMPVMNYGSSSPRVEWILRDPRTGAENMEIGWRHRVGELVKLRLRNPGGSLHPMQHPIHLHGQRFVVLSRDGAPNDNLAWKDTVLVPVGSTVDLLVELSNPGDWMLHCHIAEHLDAGMRTVLHVAPADSAAGSGAGGDGPGPEPIDPTTRERRR